MNILKLQGTILGPAVHPSRNCKCIQYFMDTYMYAVVHMWATFEYYYTSYSIPAIAGYMQYYTSYLLHYIWCLYHLMQYYTLNIIILIIPQKSLILVKLTKIGDGFLCVWLDSEIAVSLCVQCSRQESHFQRNMSKTKFIII